MPARSILFAALVLAACAPKLIPGTQIEDTEDTQAVLALLRTYESALEARDAEKIIELCADSYRDTAGTPDPEDDLQYAQLREVLPKRLNQVKDLHVELEVRELKVDGTDALATLRYNLKYRLPQYQTRSAGDADIHQMRLQKQGGTWKILSGL